METVPIPWAALLGLGSAVSAIIVALWAKIRGLERSRDEWTRRWANEVKRNAMRAYGRGEEWEEDSKVSRKREEIEDDLRDYLTGKSPKPRY